MNIVILMGKVHSEIKYDFILEGKNNAIARFRIELFDKCIVEVRAYNTIADYCYSRLNIGDVICVIGYISGKMQCIIEEIEVIGEETFSKVIT